MVNINLLEGDCLDKLKELDDNSVDSIVTDPPYGLSKEPDMMKVLKHWMNGDDYVHNSKGFMGKSWDSFVPNPNVWKECLRVLKPGGHMVAFFGTRTYDMGVLSIRIAGFEVRNQLAWAFGSGFPKSMAIDKAIDKHFNAERRVIGKREHPTLKDKSKINRQEQTQFHANNTIKDEWDITEPATDEAKQWDGWGTDVKPAFEPIVLARKPLSEKTIAANVLKHGTGGLNIDASRVPTDGDKLGGGSKDKHNFADKEGWDRPWMHDEEKVKQNIEDRLAKVEKAEQLGRFPATLIHDGSEEVVSLFPESKGQQGDVKGTEVSHTGQNGIYGEYGRVGSQKRGDTGSAARFFYCAKASKSDKNEGMPDGTKNTHVTVKPYNLMKYLATLVTPPNGTVLDPFMGSGSTGKAAVRCGFNFVGIELDPDYLQIAKARIEYARDNPEETKETKKKKTTDEKTDLPSDLFE